MLNRQKKIVVTGLTKGILVALGVGATIGVALAFPGLGILYRAYKKQQWEKAKNRGILRATVKRLERQELVSWAERGGELQLTLTDKGRKRLLQYDVDALKVDDTKRWDGLWRVVVFDVPEGERHARELFRKKIRELGLSQLQKSVFVCRFPCKDEIDFLSHALEVHRYVHYILAKEISYIK